MRKLIYFIIGAGLVAGYLAYHSYGLAVHFVDDPTSDNRVPITVAKGSSADEVANLLLDKGLIESPFFFKVYLRLNGLSGQLKAGKFVLRENYDLPAIADALIQGKAQEQAVTLLEGWTARQIGDSLESLGLTTSDAFVACVKTCAIPSLLLPKNGSAEGYLYPDTYYVDPSSYSDQSFITRLVGTLQSKLTADDLAAIKASKHSLQQVITMASIVEREERDDTERPVVAGILWKRFDNGIGLGADATLLYGLGRTSGGLTYNDLQSDSPYNTRKFRGLPPTPISNPSLSSIEASIFPKQTDYMYYLHDSKGQVHYAKTLEEHNENKVKYL
jgi:UPF0755 protein